MTRRAHDIHVLLFAAGLYALVGDAVKLIAYVTAAIELIEPNPWYAGGVNAEPAS